MQQRADNSGPSPGKPPRKAKAAPTNGAFKLPTLNLSGIHATEFNVVVRPDNFEEVTKGGVIIPDMARERQAMAAVSGTIVDVSPVAFTYERWPEGYAPPKVGDKVVLPRYCGMIVKGKDGIEYRVVKDKDVAAVLE